jgi:ubiquinone/menaquinone biosynthesis C-methylase UbiE
MSVRDDAMNENPSPETLETEGHVMSWAVPVYDMVNRLILLDWRYRCLLRDHGKLHSGVSLLDIGCGTGSLLLAAAEMSPYPVSALGIDPSQAMLSASRRKAERRGLPVEFRPGLIEDLPVPDASVDRVFLTLMVHHLPPKTLEAGLAEIHRVLRPGGFALLVDFSAVRNPIFAFFAVHFLNRSFRKQILYGLGPELRSAGFDTVTLVEKWMWAVEVYRLAKSATPILGAVEPER